MSFIKGNPFAGLGDVTFDVGQNQKQTGSVTGDQAHQFTPPHGQGTPGRPPNVVTTGADSKADHVATYYQPPRGCLVDPKAYVTIPLSRMPAGFDEMDQSQIGVPLSMLTGVQKQTLAAFQAAWATQYPMVPQASLFMSRQRAFGLGNKGDNVVISVVRPYTQWDPALLSPPPIEKGDPREVPFAAALRLFFPDLVFDQIGKNPGFYHGYGWGSYTPYGPFPLDALFVSDRMVDFCAKFIKGGGFGDPATGRDPVGSEVGSFLRTGAKLSVAAGPYGAVAGAALSIASAITDLFGSIFGGMKDPPPPPWLVKLMQVVTLRESGGGGRFGGAVQGMQGGVHGDVYCHRATIVPTIDGKYNLLDGYAEVLNRLGGSPAQKAGWLKWLMLLGTGAAMAAGG